MKMLILKDILPHIQGTVLQGSDQNTIKKVAYLPQRINYATLFFHLYKRHTKKEDLSHFTKSTIVVTDEPDFFTTNVSKDITIVVVKDVKDSYWRFIHYYRNLFDIPVIGVTGTCGKTTTTEMIKTILAKKYKVQATRTGANSTSYHLPYLLGIDEETEAAVFEFGVAYPKDIKECIDYFQPQVGVLLNIGVNHLAGCKTEDNYLNAKAEILHCLDGKGTVILNGDDERIAKIDTSTFKGNLFYFGMSKGCHYRASSIKYSKDGMKFNLHYENMVIPVVVAGYGKHTVYNALAAIASVHSIGFDLSEAIQYVASFNAIDKHLQFKKGKNGLTVIDDTWNNSTTSIEAGLDVLKETAGKRKTIACIGYMPQIEGAAHDEYKKVAEKVATLQIDKLLVVGEKAREIGLHAIEIGVGKDHVQFCNDGNELYELIKDDISASAIILLKITHRVMVQESFQSFLEKILE